jgi:hypothetical protein
MYNPAVVGWFIKWYAGSGLYSDVLIKKVVLVPSDTIASDARKGSERIVAGLSPVKAMIRQSDGKPYRPTK